jgi:hypothetical protein
VLTEARHRFALPKNDQPIPTDTISFLELEITGFCQLPVDRTTGRHADVVGVFAVR